MENLGLSGLVNLGNMFYECCNSMSFNVHELTEYFINDEYKKSENKNQRETRFK